MPTDDRPHKKWYRDNRPKNPSYHRRAAWNDYQQPRIYMITIVKNHPTPPLSDISGHGREINLTKTPTGLLVEQALTQWNRRWPEFKVDNLVIMPDHIHFILNKCQEMNTLANLICSLKPDDALKFSRG